MDWSTLTRSPRKIEHYRRETYFREAMEDAVDIFGDRVFEELHHAAFLMMKPDGLIAGKFNTVHSFVTAHEFTVVAAQELTFGRHTWRELWRYQLTSATLDRLELKELLYTTWPSLGLLLHSDAIHELPGTVRLSTLKGSADLRAQLPGTLRSQLRQPNRVFSLVHFADEPADLLRELGVLFSRPVRRRLLQALAARRMSAHDRGLVDEALARPVAGDETMALADALARMRTALDHAPDSTAATRVRGLLDAAEAGEPYEWRTLLADIRALDCPVDIWDVAVVGSYTIVADEPGEPKLIGNPDPATWRTPLVPAQATAD